MCVYVCICSNMIVFVCMCVHKYLMRPFFSVSGLFSWRRACGTWKLAGSGHDSCLWQEESSPSWAAIWWTGWRSPPSDWHNAPVLGRGFREDGMHWLKRSKSFNGLMDCGAGRAFFCQPLSPTSQRQFPTAAMLLSPASCAPAPRISCMSLLNTTPSMLTHRSWRCLLLPMVSWIEGLVLSSNEMDQYGPQRAPKQHMKGSGKL